METPAPEGVLLTLYRWLTQLRGLTVAQRTLTEGGCPCSMPFSSDTVGGKWGTLRTCIYWDTIFVTYWLAANACFPVWSFTAVKLVRTQSQTYTLISASDKCLFRFWWPKADLYVEEQLYKHGYESPKILNPSMRLCKTPNVNVHSGMSLCQLSFYLFYPRIFSNLKNRCRLEILFNNICINIALLI